MIPAANRCVFVLLLLSGFMLIGCRNKAQTEFLPTQLGGLGLTKVFEGAEAAGMIDKMHGKKLGVTENYIGYYGSKRARNVLFVSVYEIVEKAKDDLMQMAVKMEKGSRMFAPLSVEGMGDNARFRTEGMGLVHYFYRSGNLLIWWQAEPDKADASYADLRNYDFRPPQS